MTFDVHRDKDLVPFLKGARDGIPHREATLGVPYRAVMDFGLRRFIVGDFTRRKGPYLVSMDEEYDANPGARDIFPNQHREFDREH